MNSGDPFKDIPKELLPALIGMFAVVFIAVFIVYIFYLKNLQDLLKSIRKPNRSITPAKVWLVLISFLGIGFIIPSFLGTTFPPSLVMVMTLLRYGLSVFSLVWNFYMVNKISESLAAEYASRNIKTEGKPTHRIGMFMCGCNTLALLTGIPYLALIGVMASMGGLVFWILYWVTTNEYKNKLRVLSRDDSDNLIP